MQPKAFFALGMKGEFFQTVPILKDRIAVPRGFVVTSVQTLSRETGLTASQTKSALHHLQDSKRIEIKTTNKYTFISVVGYDLLQGTDVCDDKQNDKHSSKQNDKQTENKMTTREERKEIKNNQEYSLLSAGSRQVCAFARHALTAAGLPTQRKYRKRRPIRRRLSFFFS